jgi:hypothetical protein
MASRRDDAFAGRDDRRARAEKCRARPRDGTFREADSQQLGTGSGGRFSSEEE